MLTRMNDFLSGVTSRQNETTGAYDGAVRDGWNQVPASGILGGTLVATHMGWRPVEAIAIGDRVMTFDDDLQVVTGVTRTTLWSQPSFCPQAHWPLEVPAGAVGNRDVLYVLPDQAIVVESDLAEQMFGDPFALVPAMALEGFRGIRRAEPASQIEVITLQFDNDQVVFANHGALIHCPVGGSMSFLGNLLNEGGASAYAPLSLDASAQLIDGMEMMDAGAAVIVRTPAPTAYAAA